MKSESIRPTGGRHVGASALALAWLAVGAVAAGAQQPATASTTDPRASLRAGFMDAEIAVWNLEVVANSPKPPIFIPESPGNNEFSNSDIAFQGNHVFVGNYMGFAVYDVSNPATPEQISTVYCPGGQGDPSVFGNLLFYSVEATRGRIDCGDDPIEEVVSAERFRGVRIFDISDVSNPRQVAAIQTCRGSHTHTLLTAPDDPDNVFVYISGTGVPRMDEELSGCTGPGSEADPNTSYSRIEVIQVPLMAPELARVVSMPRVFADPVTGALAGLWQGGDHGPGTQSSRATMSCHDITVFPELGLAGGACSGNGILFDISDPTNPVRLDEVTDPNFSFWHSATFNNTGDKVIFTDEWGGGGQARCRVEDPMQWGANTIFTIENGKMTLAGYYKLPAAQGETENCVAHNGALIPVPGRDIMAQAWYQGGITVFDFTDPANAHEIAYFDRGPMSDAELQRSGFWGAYWYNGLLYGSEKQRGLDILRLTPSEFLTQNEIDAASLVRFEEYNPQMQPVKEWPPHVVVSKAYLDQLARNDGLPAARRAAITAELDRLDRLADAQQKRAGFAALAGQIEGDVAGSSDSAKVRLLAESVRALAR